MSKPSQTYVVALGGNSIIQKGERGTIYEQFAHTRESVRALASIIDAGHNLVITHGNGPQVGDRLLQVEAALDKVPDTPLGVLVAETQGAMGYMIEQSMQNYFTKHRIGKPVISLLTQVVVDKDDPKLLYPTKFIGSSYTEEDARKLLEIGWPMREHSSRGWRRVVPSPFPLDIVEKEQIRALVDMGVVVVCCGGGGMPVYVEQDGTYEGVDAVVDKDYSSALLAEKIDAEVLVIITEVPQVAKNFNKPGQMWLPKLTMDEAQELFDDNQFPDGSMGPKIRSAVQFLQRTDPKGTKGRKVIITNAETLPQAVRGQGGTVIMAH